MSLQKADAIIVLGRVDSHGHLTIDAHERIRHAADLYRQGIASVLIAPAKWSYRLTFTPPQTEAATIKARLVEWGVPVGAILCEEKSCDTLGAAYFLKTDFVEPNGWRDVIVVTSLDHAERTQYTFRKVFGDSLNLQYTWGNKVLSDEAFQASLVREAKSLQLMESTWFGPVTPGDHRHIEKIFELHPGYNPKAQISAEEVERRVQSQNILA